jgi:chromosome segregation protein
VVPQLGESVAEGTVSKWLKAVGDRVRKEEPLVEIQTDKINVEIPVVYDVPTIEEAATRAQHTQAEFETVQGRVGGLDAGEVGLDDHHDRTVAALRLADERVAELQSAERGAERRVASLRARIDALSVGLDRKDGAAWLQKNLAGTGLFGSVANLVRVRPGYEAAIAAVMGAAADAVAAENFGAARSAVAALKASDGGHAAIVLGDWPVETPAPTGPPPEGALWATDLVDMPSRLRGALMAMLSGVAVVRDLSAALDLVAARPQLRAVTADGDLVGAGWVSGGSDRKLSTLEITSEVEKARDELVAAEKQTGELSAALSGALATVNVVVTLGTSVKTPRPESLIASELLAVT